MFKALRFKVQGGGKSRRQGLCFMKGFKTKKASLYGKPFIGATPGR
jgi:hypothetical protein